MRLLRESTASSRSRLCWLPSRARKQAVFLAVALTGCGYVGDPLPPALNIPAAVTDLSVVQRGDKLLIRFTAPALTTEQLPIRSFDRLDVRDGPSTLLIPVPKPGETVTSEVRATEWLGREVSVTVRLVSNTGREAEWSNAVVLTARAPLPTPAPTAAAHPDGVQIRWQETPGAKYRVRKGTDVVATAEQPFYIDRAVELGKTYTYDVQAFAGLIESEVSKPVTVTARDDFAPKPPSGVTIVAGAASVELAWDRNTEPDLSSYRVYRAIGSADFTVLADAVEGLSYSDRQIEQGKTYRYRVTATDRSGNESQPSAIAEGATP